MKYTLLLFVLCLYGSSGFCGSIFVKQVFQGTSSSLDHHTLGASVVAVDQDGESGATTQGVSGHMHIGVDALSESGVMKYTGTLTNINSTAVKGRAAVPVANGAASVGLALEHNATAMAFGNYGSARQEMAQTIAHAHGVWQTQFAQLGLRVSRVHFESKSKGQYSDVSRDFVYNSAEIGLAKDFGKNRVAIAYSPSVVKSYRPKESISADQQQGLQVDSEQPDKEQHYENERLNVGMSYERSAMWHLNVGVERHFPHTLKDADNDNEISGRTESAVSSQYVTSSGWKLTQSIIVWEATDDGISRGLSLGAEKSFGRQARHVVHAGFSHEQIDDNDDSDFTAEFSTVGLSYLVNL